MRGDEGGRVQLKMARWVDRDIGRGHYRFYPIRIAEQKSAYLVGIGGRQGHDPFQQFA